MQLTLRIPDKYKDEINILSENLGIKKSDIALLA
jgi:predicted DNA-binding protein